MGHRLHLFYALLAFSFAVSAEDFDCKIQKDDFAYDLTSLAGEYSVSRTRETPPSVMVDTVTFNLCADLTAQQGIPESDQCPTGTRACLTKLNKKDDHTDRIVAVIPLAQSENIDPQYSHISSSQDSKGISLILHGASYPTSASESTPQSVNLSLLCSTDTAEPKFVSYENGEFKMEWSAPAGCGIDPSEDEGNKPEPGKEGDGDESVGSGIGWFFLLLVLAFAAYLVIGMYYNYSTYGATGADLIPHRDFWREVPYMLRDVFDHLCTSIKPRHSNRGGYIAV